ncbi:hypothetical protein MAP00_003177 [Monascus purpureus]|nr:hypothetical protein MAP00_003177 [Monascus purpureus]
MLERHSPECGIGGGGTRPMPIAGEICKRLRGTSIPESVLVSEPALDSILEFDIRLRFMTVILVPWTNSLLLHQLSLLHVSSSPARLIARLICLMASEERKRNRKTCKGVL